MFALLSNFLLVLPRPFFFGLCIPIKRTVMKAMARIPHPPAKYSSIFTQITRR